MTKKLISVVELPEFRKFAKHSLTEEECIAIVDHLALNPEEGDLIKGSGGVRKIRFASRNKGKSGGIRVLYYYYRNDVPIFLLTGFLKSNMENISNETCNDLKKIVEQINKLYKV